MREDKMFLKMIATPRLLFVALLLIVLTACGTGPTPQPTTYTVTVEIAGAGTGTVTSVPEGIDMTSGDAPGTLEVDAGTEVTLTASATGDSTFIGWSGACTGTGPCVVTVDDDVDVTATFALSTGTLTVATDGDGNVTSDPAGIDVDAGDASATFTTGEEITLTAVAATGSFFGGWDGACEGQGETCTFTFVEDTTITATFTVPVTLDVSVVSGGVAAGSVTSEPAGIDTTTDDSADFPVDTVVTLTATATAGAFSGWSGGGCDDVQVPVCEVTMDAATTVIGTFNEVQDLVVRVGAGTDDAVEFLGDSVAGQEFDPVQWQEGWIWGVRANLHLGYAVYHTQTEAAFRFPGVTVPAGAIVTSAIVQVTSTGQEDTFPMSGDLNLRIQGELSTNPSGFVQPAVTATSFAITQRPRTEATVDWNITETWSNNQVRLAPDAASVLQEIVNQSGWASGNPVALFLKGTDETSENYRRVYTFESGTPDTRHPTLIVQYVEMPPLP
jgi:hypothetical protein